jgi:hypothetical protein
MSPMRRPRRSSRRIAGTLAGFALRMLRNYSVKATKKLDEAAVVEDRGGAARFSSWMDGTFRTRGGRSERRRSGGSAARSSRWESRESARDDSRPL